MPTRPLRVSCPCRPSGKPTIVLLSCRAPSRIDGRDTFNGREMLSRLYESPDVDSSGSWRCSLKQVATVWVRPVDAPATPSPGVSASKPKASAAGKGSREEVHKHSKSARPPGRKLPSSRTHWPKLRKPWPQMVRSTVPPNESGTVSTVEPPGNSRLARPESQRQLDAPTLQNSASARKMPSSRPMPQ